VTPEAMGLLLDHTWPGNVRELENTIEHAVVLAKDIRIEPAELPAVIRASSSLKSRESDKVPTIAEQESELLRKALDECGGNKKETARRLGISRNTLYSKIKKYRIAQS
jgi:DNA-binding NtrC family response regulator